MRQFVAFLIMSVSAATSVAAPSCPIERATYVYSMGKGSANFKIVSKPKGFHTGTVLHVSFGESQSTQLWFLFDQGNSRNVSLIATGDPSQSDWKQPDPSKDEKRLLPDQRYLAWDADMKIRTSIPMQGESAPEFILVPGLADALESSLKNRAMIGEGIFRKASCD